MVQLDKLVQAWHELYRLAEYGPDRAFGKFIPMVYDPIGYAWREEFEPDFVRLFNGLMIRGDEQVRTVFLAVFPTEHVLERFLAEAEEGDVLFMHHPLLMECGDPQGQWGRGFVPIPADLIARVKERRLSIFTVHGPMDPHLQVGTTAAMAEALNGTFVAGFLPGHDGFTGQVVDIEKIGTKDLIEKLKGIFEIPYVDFEGRELEEIERVALVAGCGDKAEFMKEAQSLGAQAYISGEIHCHIDNDYGRMRFGQIIEYAAETSMSLIGVSHSASEYLVKKTQMSRWLEERFAVQTRLIPQEKWWL